MVVKNVILTAFITNTKRTWNVYPVQSPESRFFRGRTSFLSDASVASKG